MRTNVAQRTPHAVSEFELALLERLLPIGHCAREALLAQAMRASVSWLDSLGQPAIRFVVPDSVELAPCNGVVAEAYAIDRDREEVHLLLHVRHGKLAEVEYYRGDGRAVVELPRIENLTIVS
jgi:glutathione S-transferase